MPSEYTSAKKEPSWLPILPPMPRISVSTNSRARLSHRRPVLLSPPTRIPPLGVVASSPPSRFSPKSTNESAESPNLETLSADAPSPPSSGSSPSRAATAAEGSWPASSSSAGLETVDAAASSEAGSRPVHLRSISSMDSSGNLSSLRTASEFMAPSNFEECISANNSHSPVSFPSARISNPPALQQGGHPGVKENGVGFGMGSVDGVNGANDPDISGLRRDRCTSSGIKFTVAETTSSAGCLDGLEELDEHRGAGIRVNQDNCLDVCREAETSDLVKSEEVVQDEGELEEGQLPGDGVNGANDPDIGGFSRDRCTSSDIKFTVAETTSSAGCLDGLEELDEHRGAGIRVNQDNCLDVCREAETSGLIKNEEVVQDEGELEEGQLQGDGGNEAIDLDFGRSSKDVCTSSGMEITTAESTSSASYHITFEEVDGCRRVDTRVNQENRSDISRETKVSDLVKNEEHVLEEGELEEGQLPGEWSGGEESHEDSDPTQMLEDSAAVFPLVRGVPTNPMTGNVANQIYYPSQVEEIHSEQKIGGNSKAKGKKKKKHKKGEGSKKRSREKSKEKYNEVLKKRRAEGKGLDGGSNSGGLRNNKDSSGRGGQTGNSNGTGKLNKVPDNVSQTLPKKPTVDEGPEDGEILLESTKTNDGILCSLVDAEVGLWTTDDVDDQFVAEMEQDGAVKKKRGPETAERKLKRKIAKRKKRAQKERELGIRRPPRTVQSKPVKVLCTHYMKGRCAKGDQCTFSHDAIPLTKQEPCKFLMSHSCLKGDDCPYSHDLRAFPCKFFHTRGLCYDGENCQFSHGAISEEALAKLKQRVEKEKKERISSTSALDIPMPSFSTPLPPELDPDPLGWGTPSLCPSHEVQTLYTNSTIMDRSPHFYSDFNLDNQASMPPAVGMMPDQSIVLSTTSIDRKDTEFDAVSPPRIGEEADEYQYILLSKTKALESEKSRDLRRYESEGASSMPMGLASTEGLYLSAVPNVLETYVFPSPPNERSNAREVLEVPRMEGKMDPGQSPQKEPWTSSNESGPQDVFSGPPSLVSPLPARTVVPTLRGRQLGSLVLEHQKVLQSPLQGESNRQHTVESLLDKALRQ